MNPKNSGMSASLFNLQGPWKLSYAKVNGETVPQNKLRDAMLLIRGSLFIESIEGQENQGKITLDPSQKPKWIDIQFIDGENKGREQSGIYEIDGDKLTLCFGLPGFERPKQLDASKDSGNILECWIKISR